MGYFVLTIILAFMCLAAYVFGRSLSETQDTTDRFDQAVSRKTMRDTGNAMKVGSLVTFLLLFAIWTAVRTFHSVPAGHVGVVYQFGNIVDQTEAGLVTTMPWQNLREANVQVQRVQFEQLDSFSEETQDVFIGATINYQVNPNDIQDLYRNVGPDYFNKLVPNRVNQFFKDETVKYKAVRIAPNREAIRTNVAQRLKDELSPFSIQVDDLLIDNIKFSPEFTKAIEDKQIATQQAQAAQNRVRQAQFEADQAIERAQGEATAYRLKRQTLTPLLVQQNAIDKLNPNVRVILLPSNSNFLLPGSLLEGSEPARGGG
jgi:regulator of protease activity HflC (stomatin/prohibitin superfamily)